MVIKEMNAGSLKIPYEAPLTEIVLVQSEDLMDPKSWVPNGNYDDRLDIIEGDFDPSDDGKGAKGNLWDDGSNNGMWDD